MPNENCSVPINVAGEQNAADGNGYMGLCPITGLPGVSIYYEAALGMLISPLENDTFYHCSFAVSLAEISQFAVSHLGISFQVTSQQHVFSEFNIVESSIDHPEYITSKTEWTLVSGLYKAIGDERFVMVGLMPPFNLNDRLSVSGGSGGWCFYYLDNVIVRKATPDEINSVRENRLGLQLAPSPTAGPLTIEAKARLREAWVMDMSGRRLWPMQGSGTRWHTDLSGLAAGVYLVEAVAEDGRRAVQKAVLMSN